MATVSAEEGRARLHANVMTECDALIALAKQCQGASDCDDSVNLNRLVHHGSLILTRLGAMNDLYERVDDEAKITRERRDQLRVEMSMCDTYKRIAADMPDSYLTKLHMPRARMEAFAKEMQSAMEERHVAQALALANPTSAHDSERRSFAHRAEERHVTPAMDAQARTS
jgi:hypothetical protein